MVEQTGSNKKTDTSAAEEKKRRKKITGLLFAGVLILGALLPSRYKALAPLLFLLSPLFDVLGKLRDDSIQTGSTPGNETQSTYMPPLKSSSEPYSYKPRDPKDPRKYKPIG